MKRIILMLCCVLFSWNASALEVAGVKPADSVTLGDRVLVLNGAGLRTRFFFKVYVAALYLPAKQTAADTIITADDHPYRIALHMLRDLGEKRFLDAFIEAIDENHTKAEMETMHDQIMQMTDIFQRVKDVHSGDVITMDYSPGKGTRIAVNGVEYGTVAGEMFHRALLKIWLGTHPVQSDLKAALLGEK
ncbi:MAG: chalcone isomerase family protein [Gallionella sp.]